MTCGDLEVLLAAGLDHTLVVIPPGEPTMASDLARTGMSYFNDNADAPAVAVVLTNDRPTLEILLGAILAGVRLLSLPLPARGTKVEDHLALIRSACRTHSVGEVVARDDLAALIPASDIRVTAHSRLQASTHPLAAPSERGFELIQFTSGSTRAPKGVILNSAALGANISAILDRVAPRPGDNTVSWLPLSHDMGLIGMVLSTIVGMGPDGAGGGRLVLLDPQRFLRDPSEWLVALSTWKGTVTAAPDFGFSMTTVRRTTGPLDLSRVRCAIIGGEMIRHETLTSFCDTFADSGLSRNALCPAYGLAEMGLAASMTAPGTPWQDLEVSMEALFDGRIEPPGSEGGVARLVSSGPALPGYDIAVRTLPSKVGPIRISGPSIGLDPITRRSLATRNGWLETGDLGFSRAGELYVCGRTDDYVVVHGRNLHAPTVEQHMSEVSGARAGRTALVSAPDGRWLVVFEATERNPLSQIELHALRSAVRRAVSRLTGATPDEIVVVPRGTLPLTASGKLRRGEILARWGRGDLGQ